MHPKKRFSKINIEISNICNLQCSFCPEVLRPHGMMEPDFFRRVVTQAAPLTDQVCLHLMGDPLVHPKLEQFADACSDARVPVFLVTNGVLLREAQAEILLRPIFRQVCFSLHSFFDNFGDRDPAPYLERIFSFTERALTERPELYVNFRLWNLDGPECATTAKRNLEMLERIETRFGVSIPRGVDVRRSKGVRLKGRLYAHFDTEFVWPSLDAPVRGQIGTCYGLDSHFGILVDGTVVPCCLDKEGMIPLGNLKTQNLLEVLDGEKAQTILAGFRANRLIDPLCQRCTYVTRFDGKLAKPSERRLSESLKNAKSPKNPSAPKIHAPTMVRT